MPYGFKLGGLSNRRGSWEPLMAFQEEAYGAWALEFTVQAGMKRFCYSVAKWYLTLWDTKDCSTPGFPALHYFPEFAHTHVHWVSDAIQPSYTLSPLLLLPSAFPSIRGFSNGLALHIWWPKYWSFSFSISPSNEYLGLISFRID